MTMVTLVSLMWNPRRVVVWAPLRGCLRSSEWGALTRMSPNQICIDKGRPYNGVYVASSTLEW